MNEQYIYSGSSSIAATFANYIVEFKKYYPDYRVTKFNEYFDVYVYIDNWTYDNENTSNPDVRTGTRSYYFICPKKTRLCTVTKDLNCKKIDTFGQSNSGATIPVFLKLKKMVALFSVFRISTKLVNMQINQKIIVVITRVLVIVVKSVEWDIGIEVIKNMAGLMTKQLEMVMAR